MSTSYIVGDEGDVAAKPHCCHLCDRMYIAQVRAKHPDMVSFVRMCQGFLELLILVIAVIPWWQETLERHLTTVHRLTAVNPADTVEGSHTELSGMPAGRVSPSNGDDRKVWMPLRMQNPKCIETTRHDVFIDSPMDYWCRPLPYPYPHPTL